MRPSGKAATMARSAREYHHYGRWHNGGRKPRTQARRGAKIRSGGPGIKSTRVAWCKGHAPDPTTGADRLSSFGGGPSTDSATTFSPLRMIRPNGRFSSRSAPPFFPLIVRNSSESPCAPEVITHVRNRVGEGCEPSCRSRCTDGRDGSTLERPFTHQPKKKMKRERAYPYVCTWSMWKWMQNSRSHTAQIDTTTDRV
jgi:hypothetical protein